jgi:hypothetical protein
MSTAGRQAAEQFVAGRQPMIDKASKTFEASVSETTKCDVCGTTSSRGGGFTNLSSGKTGESQVMCPSCWNDFAADRMGVEPPESSDLKPVKILDCDGRPHEFEFEVRLSTGLGVVAYELVNGERGLGYEFSVLEHPETPLRQAYAKLIAKIAAGLSVKYLETKNDHHFRWGQTYIAGSAVNGRVEEHRDEETGEEQLGVVVDGRFLTFEEFGRALSSYIGFNFRLETFDACDSMDISAKPERPDPVPWLERGTGGNANE